MLAELIITSMVKIASSDISDAEWLNRLCDASVEVTATKGEERLERLAHPVYRTPFGDYALVDLPEGYTVRHGDAVLESVDALDDRLQLVRAPPRSLPPPLDEVPIPAAPKEVVDACFALAMDGIAPPFVDVDEARCASVRTYTAHDPLLACAPSSEGLETMFFHGGTILRSEGEMLGIKAHAIVAPEVFTYGMPVRIPRGGAVGYVILQQQKGPVAGVVVRGVQQMKELVEPLVLGYEKKDLRERLSE